MVYDNILEIVGNTPMVKLNKIVPEGCADILVKVESLDVGGSIKTRVGLEMIKRAEAEGRLTPESIIVEPTSGNQGIGLALVGAVKGYKTIIIMPDSVSEERRRLCEHYGAQVVLIHDKGNIGECISECAFQAFKMSQMNSHVFVPQQFINRNNIVAHYEKTGTSIVEQVGKKIDGFVSGIGTGGTISGVGKILRENNPDCEIWALEPDKAAILSKQPISSHLQMGIGDGIIPAILDQNIYDEVHIITDEEAIQTARNLAKMEGLMVGISSGTNVAGAIKLAKKLGPGKTVVTVLPDTAERYFSTPLFK